MSTQTVEQFEPLDDDFHTEEDEPLDEFSREFVEKLIDKVMQFMVALVGHDLHPYQKPFARRLIESVIINDGEEITALAARQSGKSETIANVVSTLMVLMPLLAKMYPDLLGKYKDGLWVGMFAPVEGQAETLFGRTVSRLTSERANEILGDPEIDDMTARTQTKTKGIRLKKSGSMVMMMTANPRAQIESKSFHLIIVDECFPYDTPVLTNEGWLRIGDIVENERRDLFVASQAANGNMMWAPIKSAYKTPRHNELVRVVHEHGTVYCTANHPFVVGDARVPAQDLQPGTPLFLVPGAGKSANSASSAPTDHSGVYSGLLASDVRVAAGSNSAEGCCGGARGAHVEGEAESGGCGAHAGEQPHETRRDAREGFSEAEGDWTPPQGAGREWNRLDRATATALGRLGSRVGGRACRRYWVASEGRSTESLQDRPGESRTDDCRGSGRKLPRSAGPKGSGLPERTVPVLSRVVSVEVLEPGDPDWDRFSDRVGYVYTLGVDSPSHTYVAAGIVVGNCQSADDFVVNKSIMPMGAYYNATKVKTGTPTTSKNNFYRSIQLNKRKQTGRNSRQNHFQWDWKEVAKVNKNYETFIKREKLRIGEDSDEFLLSYCCTWLLERGMFVTSSIMDELGDTSMETVKSWVQSPVVVGIDPARKVDSTVVTVVWVDWDRPDEFGYFDHRILNWLEIQGDDWEEQYAQIVAFLSNYDVLAVGVDAQGVGDAVAQRLRLLLPRAEVISVGSNASEQSKRWKHLQALIQRKMVGWPAHAKTRRLRTYKRFYQQCTDAEIRWSGPNYLVAAPDEAHAHDDYVDSLAIACSLTADQVMPTIEVSRNLFYSGR